MPRRSATVDPDDPAPALTRGLAILSSLGRDGPQVLERLAAANGMPKSSTLRLLAALERLGMVARDPATRRWLARAAIVHGADQGAEDARLRQVLADLARDSGHTAEAWRLRDGCLHLVDRADPEDLTTAVRARIGFVRSMAEADAAVLALLSTGASMAAAHGNPRQARDRRLLPISRADLARQVAACRAAGCIADPGVNANGVRRFAAPWRGADGAAVGAIAIAQAGGLPPGDGDAVLLDLVRQAAARLGRE